MWTDIDSILVDEAFYPRNGQWLLPIGSPITAAETNNHYSSFSAI